MIDEHRVPISPTLEPPRGRSSGVRSGLLRLLPHGSIARSLAVVGGATAIGQGAIVLGAPLLSRLYGPEAFGALSVFAAILSVLLAMASLRYDFAIPVARTPDEAVQLVALSGLLAVATAAALAVVLAVAGTAILHALGAAALVPYWWLLPVGLLAGGLAQPLASWAIYRREYGGLARMRSLQGVSQVVSQALLGVANLGILGLLIGDTVGRVAGLERIARSAGAALRSTTISLASLRRAAGAHWGFARVMTAASLLNALSLQIPFLLIPILFDLSSAGQYFLAHRVLVLPASLVAAAVNQVFFGEAAFRRDDAQRLRSLARSAAISLLIFAIPTYTIVLVAGPPLIRSVFGSEWDLAGTFAQISAPWLILWSVANPISGLLLVGRRERESLAFTAAELAVKAGALLAGAALHSLIAGIVILSIASVAINFAGVWRFLRVARVGIGELFRPAVRIVAICLVPVGTVAVVAVVAPAALVVVSAVAWLVAIGLCIRFSPEPRALQATSHD